MKLEHALPPSQIKGRRVFVYKNLHEDCWSVKDMQSGRVVAHADRVELSDVDLKVSQSGRRRVLEEKRKNVHAGVVGTAEKIQLRAMPSQKFVFKGEEREDVRPITYNPYKYESFVTKGDEQPVHHADAAVLEPDGRSVWVLNPAG